MWSYLGVSHLSAEGSTPSFHQLRQRFSWAISGNSLIAHIHITLLWVLFAFLPAHAPGPLSPRFLFLHQRAKQSLTPNLPLLPNGVKQTTKIQGIPCYPNLSFCALGEDEVGRTNDSVMWVLGGTDMVTRRRPRVLPPRVSGAPLRLLLTEIREHFLTLSFTAAGEPQWPASGPCAVPYQHPCSPAFLRR